MKKLPNSIDVHVGARIRLRRRTIGMSQETLADGLGITFQQVQKYEKGMNRVGASRLQNIAEILNVPIPYFFEESPGMLGESMDMGANELNDFMSSKEGIALASAFLAIEDKRIRQNIMNLLRSLGPSASTQSDSDSAIHASH
ncbi:helix-turn-helix transcriptional regulator (plasmid) [Peteryoungia desertarenae]|uniref:Helix-turn-helix transcriptional regulator n=1 Tax=Peteryoungia desertarenae TaxID=1813451 RepID=A0ABX6QTU5_9HYPH|nr:helix-turn-helix transcriptional regulator [Peteryoungia desertarenae]QLF71960.1 helix-turn-helix transcriptional regulator [Peteryoungia desertarenae]